MDLWNCEDQMVKNSKLHSTQLLQIIFSGLKKSFKYKIQIKTNFTIFLVNTAV